MTQNKALSSLTNDQSTAAGLALAPVLALA